MTNRITQRTEGGVRHGPRLMGALALAGALAVAGCDSLLDVSNPNNVAQEDVEQPQAASAMVNGAAARSALAYAFVNRLEITVSDEVVQSGSWDAARDMNNGNVRDPGNADSNTGFNNMAVARWMADEALKFVRQHEQEGVLPNRADFIDAHLYPGLARLLIGTHFEDFVFSDRVTPGAPIGEQNMGQVFDQALEFFTQMRTAAQAANDRERERQAVALIARTHWAKALVLQKMQPRGQVPSDPLVNNAEANAAAQAFFNLGPEPDWRFAHTYSPDTNANTISGWINSRREIVPAPRYAVVDGGLNITGTVLEDPIDGIPDPALTRRIAENVSGVDWAPLPVVSARELHLILAEAALATGNTSEFESRINAVRALEELSPYTGQIPALDMLIHARNVNLYLMGRRLADQYRFRIASESWLPNSDAMTRPGSFLPIGEEERQTNCHFLGTC